MTTPEAASPLPLKGATPTARQSRFRGVRWIALFAVASLQACVVVPQTREVYDADCRVMKREMTLETTQVGAFKQCTGDACKATMLVTTGAVSAVSAVVSGSIALVGNAVYWFERQGNCPGAKPAATAASAAV